MKTKVFSGTPGVGKTTYMKRYNLITTKPELADNPELLKRFKPYLLDKSKLTFDIQHELSEELIKLYELHSDNLYLDRTFLDGYAIALMQFIYYRKPLDLLSMLDYIFNKAEKLKLSDKLTYIIFTTSWSNNLERIKKRGRDIDEQDLEWYKFCNENFISYMTFVLNKFGIEYKVEVL